MVANGSEHSSERLSFDARDFRDDKDQLFSAELDGDVDGGNGALCVIHEWREEHGPQRIQVVRLEDNNVGRIRAAADVRILKDVELPQLPGPQAVAKHAAFFNTSIVVVDRLGIFFGPLRGASIRGGCIRLADGGADSFFGNDVGAHTSRFRLRQQIRVDPEFGLAHGIRLRPFRPAVILRTSGLVERKR